MLQPVIPPTARSERPAATRGQRLVSGLLLATAAVLAATTVAAHLANRGSGLSEAWPDLTSWFWLVNASSALMWAVPGWYLARHRPRVVYGWLALAAGVAHGLGGLGLEWAVADHLGGAALPWSAAGLWLAAWAPLVEQPVLMAAYGLYPDGRLARGWLRWATLGSIGLALLAVVEAALDRHPGRGAEAGPLRAVTIPFGVPGAHSSPSAMALLFAPAAVLVMVVLVVRWRRASGDERRVLSWIVAIGVPVTVVVPPSVVLLPDGIGTAIAQGTTLLELGVIVAATLRNRVYGIVVVLNRALVYVILTVLVTLLCAAATVASQAVGVRTAGLPAFGAALLALMLVAPARDRVQRAVNSFLYGARDDPYRVLSRAAAELEVAGSPRELLASLVEVTASTLKLSYVAVELDRPPHPDVLATGSDPGTAVRMALVHRGRALGTLVVGRRPGESRTPPHEAALLEDLARQIAIAASTVVLTAELQQSREGIVLAREEERRRLRMDLHDGVGPQLTGIALGLDVMGERVKDVAPDAAAAADALRGELQEAIIDIRRVVQGLRPPRIDEVGLLGAVDEAVERARRGGLAVEFEPRGPSVAGTLPAAVEVAAYRIVTEALTNVVRHAGATRCRVEVVIAGGIRIRVTDDGSGLGEQAPGTGMESMRQRAEELGGTFAAGPGPGRGSLVQAWIPLEGA